MKRTEERGRVIVPSLRIIIEIGGTPEEIIDDAERDAALLKTGWRTVRISNEDVDSGNFAVLEEELAQMKFPVVG